MTKFQLIFSVFIASCAFAAACAAKPGALAQESHRADATQIAGEANAVKNAARGAAEIRFYAGSMQDLYVAPMRGTMARIERAEGVAEKTRIWVAHADLARTPGMETIIHVKSPISCGSAGCELVILSGTGDSQKVLLRTIGETISSPAYDRVVINEGSWSETTWEFNGAKFVRRRK